jgi:hypothetical protein
MAMALLRALPHALLRIEQLQAAKLVGPALHQVGLRQKVGGDARDREHEA